MKRNIIRLLHKLELNKGGIWYIKSFSDNSHILYNFSDKAIATCNSEKELIIAIKTEIEN